MSALPPRTIFLRNLKRDSWFARVSENLRQLWISTPLQPGAANGAPLHIVDSGAERVGWAQAYSVLTHVLALILFLYFAAQTRVLPSHRAGEAPEHGPILPISSRTLAKLFGHASPGNRGASGDQNPIPATSGNLAPRSPIQLLSPRLPQNPKPELPVPVTILDAQAPPQFTAVANIGLPWMPSETDSPGLGKGHGIGSRPGVGMGDSMKDDEGFSNDSTNYANVVSWPVCSYCPDPTYGDEARKAKVQGTITLRVLVTPEGKAAQIQVVKGVGFDLDERAQQTVKTWRFIPARDLTQHRVPVWMTVEVLYRLF